MQACVDGAQDGVLNDGAEVLSRALVALDGGGLLTGGLSDVVRQVGVLHLLFLSVADRYLTVVPICNRQTKLWHAADNLRVLGQIGYCACTMQQQMLGESSYGGRSFSILPVDALQVFSAHCDLLRIKERNTGGGRNADKKY